MTDDPANILHLTAEIVAAHVEHNRVHAGEVGGLIKTIYDALSGLDQPQADEPSVQAPEAAVSVRKSLSDPTRILSMIDGKPYSTLTRHIKRHGHTPDTYRAAFGLKPDYPMVAPAYVEQRREIATRLGLGRKKKTGGEPQTPARKARQPKAS